MRKKLPDSEKKTKITATIDKEIYDMLEEHLKSINFSNKSKYIEWILKKELNKNKNN